TVQLHGKRLEGQWTLVPAHLDGDPKNWLLLRKDGANPTASGYGLMLATSVDEAPVGDDWVYEVKWDGFRALAIVRGGEAALVSRNANDLTGRFPTVVRAIEHAVRTPNVVLDGEICALDEAGRPRFGALQTGTGALVYYVFDILERDGEPVTALPLLE